MNTSDHTVAGVSPAGNVGGSNGTENLPAALASLPDPAVIARLANEFFAALPDRPAPPTVPLDAHAVPPTSAFSPPTAAELRPLPASLAGAKGPAPQVGASLSIPLGPYDFRPELIPDPGLAALALPPTEVASPLAPPAEVASPPAASAAPPAAGFAPPTEADLRALPATLADAPGSPLPVGATAPGPASSGSTFYFLDAARLAPPSTAPAFPSELHEFEAGMLPDLRITAGPYDPRVARNHFPASKA